MQPRLTRLPKRQKVRCRCSIGSVLPSLAFGNSDGDQPMLERTTAGPGPRFALIVHHTDAEREWAYDRDSHVGKLDRAWDEANAKGWTVVSMKDDWATIFPCHQNEDRAIKPAHAPPGGTLPSPP